MAQYKWRSKSKKWAHPSKIKTKPLISFDGPTRQSESRRKKWCDVTKGGPIYSKGGVMVLHFNPRDKWLYKVYTALSQIPRYHNLSITRFITSSLLSGHINPPENRALFLPYHVMAYFLFNGMYEYICCIHFSFRTYYDVFISEKNSKHLQNTNEISLRQLNDSKVEISRRQYDREDEEIVFFIETKLMKMFLLFVKRMSLFWWYIITETTRHNCLTY